MIHPIRFMNIIQQFLVLKLRFQTNREKQERGIRSSLSQFSTVFTTKSILIVYHNITYYLIISFYSLMVSHKSEESQPQIPLKWNCFLLPAQTEETMVVAQKSNNNRQERPTEDY